MILEEKLVSHEGQSTDVLAVWHNISSYTEVYSCLLLIIKVWNSLYPVFPLYVYVSPFYITLLKENEVCP